MPGLYYQIPLFKQIYCLMDLVLDDNYNIIVLEGSGGLLNGSCELDGIKGFF